MQNRKYLIAASALAFVPAGFAQDKPMPPSREPAPAQAGDMVPDKLFICRAADLGR